MRTVSDYGKTKKVSSCCTKVGWLKASRLTWMLALQRVVMLEILPPVTPGGFNANMDWRMVSSSATQDMAAVSENRLIQLTSANPAVLLIEEYYGRSTTNFLFSQGK